MELMPVHLGELLQRIREAHRQQLRALICVDSHIMVLRLDRDQPSAAPFG